MFEQHSIAECRPNYAYLLIILFNHFGGQKDRTIPNTSMESNSVLGHWDYGLEASLGLKARACLSRTLWKFNSFLLSATTFSKNCELLMKLVGWVWRAILALGLCGFFGDCGSTTLLLFNFHKQIFICVYSSVVALECRSDCHLCFGGRRRKNEAILVSFDLWEKCFDRQNGIFGSDGEVAGHSSWRWALVNCVKLIAAEDG